jgi:hypothetical protein
MCIILLTCPPALYPAYHGDQGNGSQEEGNQNWLMAEENGAKARYARVVDIIDWTKGQLSTV